MPERWLEWIHSLAKRDWSGVAGVVLSYSCTQFAFASRTSFAYDRPVHFCLSILLSLAALTFAVGWYDGLIASLFGWRRENGNDDLWSSKTSFRSVFKDVRSPRLLFVGLIVAICLRIIIFKQAVRNSECTVTDLSAFVPLIYILLERILSDGADITKVRHAPFAGPASLPVQRSTLATVFFYGVSAYVMRSSNLGPKSTTICPSTSTLSASIPLLQHLGTVLDSFIIFCIYFLSVRHSHNDIRTLSLRNSLRFLFLAFLICSLIVIAHGLIWFIFVPEDRYWTAVIPFRFVWAAAKLDFLICVIAIAFSITVSTAGIILTVFNMSCSVTFGIFFANTTFLPAHAPSLALAAFLSTCLSTLCYLHQATNSADPVSPGVTKVSNRQRLFGGIFMAFLVIFGTLVQLRHWPHDHLHPVDRLVKEAEARHGEWMGRAASSSSLATAARIYRARHGRDPPPSFDEWYKYALARNTRIIDNFDSIDRDLEPFWQLSPVQLRQRTWQAMKREENDVTGIIIRNGVAQANPDVRPTHKWMLEGLLSMISKFEKDLPDMDIAFNTNDEPRVAPLSPIPVHYDTGRGRKLVDRRGPSPNFSPNRLKSWQESARLATSPMPISHLSFQNIFYDFGTAVCPSSTNANSEFRWDQSLLCSDCIEGHSDGVFIANRTRSKDVCSQPDVAHLHGFYSSPSSFKGTHDLYPIFSQSKAPGFADILYPSAWNYMDKVRYGPSEEYPDPPFTSKNSTLYWRGATTEGVSPGNGVYKGFSRQRFHHIANSAAAPNALILLPSSSSRSSSTVTGSVKPQTYRYTYLSSATLQSHLKTDIRFTAPILRCGDPDCAAQAAEFAPLVTQPADFQTHWSYRYILDLDGAGFSGRFLPFLQSRSLPFKAALFEEWFDDRLTPWRHYVPLDLRGQGFWATLAYFAGFEGTVGGRRVRMEGRTEVGERIAEAGREWANEVLRKEDMEIYMFRLLLEWGRLTDDRRDEIGYAG